MHTTYRRDVSPISPVEIHQEPNESGLHQKRHSASACSLVIGRDMPQRERLFRTQGAPSPRRLLSRVVSSSCLTHGTRCGIIMASSFMDCGGPRGPLLAACVALSDRSRICRDVLHQARPIMVVRSGQESHRSRRLSCAIISALVIMTSKQLA